MSERMVIGVDCGLTGAIAFTVGDELVDVVDMPTVGRGKAGKQSVNAAALAEVFHSTLGTSRRARAVVERVGSMPGQGLSSTFNFGVSYGAVLGVLGALQIPVHHVTPQVWKRHFGLIGAEKDASRGKAIDLFPDAPLSRKRDHGRAEAILIALWGHHHAD